MLYKHTWNVVHVVLVFPRGLPSKSVCAFLIHSEDASESSLRMIFNYEISCNNEKYYKFLFFFVEKEGRIEDV